MIQHGGNPRHFAALAHCREEELLDFSVNLHYDGMPEGLPQALLRALNDVGSYPEPHAERLAALAAARWNRAPEEFLAGNGSSELLELVPRVLPIRGALIVTPGYLEYAEACRKAGVAVREFRLKPEHDFRLDVDVLAAAALPGELVILGNPDNPTGGGIPARGLREAIRNRGDVFFLIDEAFADFSGETLLDLPPLPNALILRSLTKFYAMPGIRIGFLNAAPQWIDAARELQTVWSVGTMAEHAAEFLLTEADRGCGELAELRSGLAAGLAACGWKIYPSCANYLLCRTPEPMFRPLLERRILVRDCSNYPGLDEHFIRVAVRNGADNESLLRAVQGRRAPAIVRKHPKPALMIQGTCSNAGKSVLAAAFCRILLQDGYSVAPFKAQNMALNSYVTPDGGEIGRAQALQAEAGRIDPDVRMNPILLKPNSELGSQLVVLGRAVGNFSVREYFRKKPELWETVTRAYDSLSSEYDCMVLEGAGSPGEINLKSNDLVNMRMAMHAHSPVLLAGDIDRGGVYAAFLGTFQTFEPKERRLLAGFLVNKFRGDPSLLEDAHRCIESMTGKPVWGVIDYLPNLALPAEDSVNFTFARDIPKEERTLDVAVLHLGHIANFTDFAPLEQEPDVRLRIVRSGAELGTPDMILIPGSKSVAADIAVLHETGLWERLLHTQSYLCGICGGLQILGKRLLDPDAVESAEPAAEGLARLPLETVMRRRKTLRRTRGSRLGEPLYGYEIHHGETRAAGGPVTIHYSDDGREIGYDTEQCFATYLHGIFDDDAFRRKFLNRLRTAKNWPAIFPGTEYGVEPALNHLADHVRSRIDLATLYRRMGL